MGCRERAAIWGVREGVVGFKGGWVRVVVGRRDWEREEKLGDIFLGRGLVWL